MTQQPAPPTRGALVLCGGRSTRMGRDKATLPFGGETLLERAVRRVSQVVADVTVVARPGQDLPPLPPDVIVVHDEVLDQGPLGGLAPGLRAARADAVFATACDVPFLEPALVELLFDRLGDHDVAVAEAEGYTHPLCAVYRPRVASRIDALLAAGRRRPVFLYDEVPTVRVGEDELRRADPELRSLANLNRPDAYEAALAQLRPRVRVEFYDVARARAGVPAVEVEAGTVGEAVIAAARRCPGLVPEVVRDGALTEHWRVSLGGREFVTDADTPLTGGDALLLLSAQVGG